MNDGQPMTIVPSPQPDLRRPFSWQDIFEAYALGHIREEIFREYMRNTPLFAAWMTAKAKHVRAIVEARL